MQMHRLIFNVNASYSFLNAFNYTKVTRKNKQTEPNRKKTLKKKS